MRPVHIFSLIAFLSLLPASLHASDQLHFARINHSPIQNVGEKIIKEVYRKAGLDIAVEELPAKRAAYAASMGERDGEIMRIHEYHEAKPQLHRIPYSLGDVKTQVYVRETDSKLQFEHLSLYLVAVVRGVRHANIYVKDFPRVMQVDNAAKAMQLLSRGRVTAVVLSKLNGDYEIRSQKLTGIVPLSDPVKVRGLYHYINSKHPDIIQLIESTLKSMHTSGELKELWNRYAEEELSQPRL